MIDVPALAPAAATTPRDRSAPRPPLAERIAPAEFAAFYDRVAPRLHGWLRWRTGDAAAADDLVQEAFARVLASGLEPESEEHLVRYLYRTAAHLVSDRRRLLPRAPEPIAGDEPAAASAPEGLRHDLERALGALAPKERQLLWLAHVEELDHRAIAEVVGARAGSVRVMLFRARRRLAGLLGRPAAPSRRTR